MFPLAVTPIHFAEAELDQPLAAVMMKAFDPAVKPVVPLGTEVIFQYGSREPVVPNPVFIRPSIEKKIKHRHS